MQAAGVLRTFEETRMLKLAPAVYNAPLAITPRSKTEPGEGTCLEP